MTALAIAVRALVLFGLLTAPAVAQSDDNAVMTPVDKTQVLIGTGSITGVYYPAGGALCAAVNSDRPNHHIRCIVRPSDGSVANVEDLRNGRVQFAIVQSDIQYSAVNGTGPFKERGPLKRLRSVFSLYSESLTIVASGTSGIRNFEDLRGKRVNVGPTGSGARATLDGLMTKYGWKYSDFSEASDLLPATLVQALCAGRIDAMVLLAGHPNSALQDVSNNCPTVVVPIEGRKRDELLDENKYYGTAVVPGGLYRNSNRDVPTFGVLATLVTTDDVPSDVVYTVTKEFMEQLPRVQKMHPALSRMNKSTMAYAGLTAPLAEGAVKYYREMGLIPTN